MRDLILVMVRGSSVVFVLLGIPLWQRRVKPNALYGLRVAATYEDESVWYHANALSGRDLVVVGVITCLATLLLRWTPMSDELYAGVLVGWTLIATLTSAVIGIRRANTMLQERGGGPRR